MPLTGLPARVSDVSAAYSAAESANSLYDDFRRGDTALGSLGNAAVGGAWEMRGANFATPCTVSRISNGKWVSAAGDVAYALKTFPFTCTKMGAVIHWTQAAGASVHGVFTMAIFPTGTTFPIAGQFNLGLHLTVTPAAWAVQVVENNVFTSIKSGNFSTPLSYNTDYRVEVTIAGDRVFYQICGVIGIATDARFETYSGNIAYWEHYYSSAVDVKSLLVVDRVWGGSQEYPGWGLSTRRTHTLPAAAVDLVANTPKTITSITLPPGVWLVWGGIVWTAKTGTQTYTLVGTSTTTDSMPSQLTGSGGMAAAHTGDVVISGANSKQLIPQFTYSLAASTTLYLVGQIDSGTASACGHIEAVRVA